VLFVKRGKKRRENVETVCSLLLGAGFFFIVQTLYSRQSAKPWIEVSSRIKELSLQSFISYWDVEFFNIQLGQGKIQKEILLITEPSQTSIKKDT